MMKLLVVFAAMAVMACAEKARYDNYKVYKVTPTTLEQLDALRYLEEHSDSYSFWKQSRGVGHDADIMVAPHKFSDFHDMIQLSGMKYSVMIDDVQRNINAEEVASRRAAGFGWNAYHSLDDIYAWLRQLADGYSQVTLIKAGNSTQDREILGVKISFGAKKPGVFIESGVHANEWITPATATFIINELLTSTDSAVKKVAKAWDWYIFPSVNPDGYAHTWNSDRMWRKNRNKYGISYGVNINRNWGYHWMEGGASSATTSDTYAGPSPFSEAETKSLAEYYTTLKDVKVYVSLHSYSQLLVFPWAYTTERVQNFDDLMAIGNKAATAMVKRHGTLLEVGPIFETIYPASGSSLDWVYGVQNTPVVFSYELRDLGRYGYLLPVEEIVPSGQELLDSFIALLNESIDQGYGR